MHTCSMASMLPDSFPFAPVLAQSIPKGREKAAKKFQKVLDFYFLP